MVCAVSGVQVICGNVKDIIFHFIQYMHFIVFIFYPRQLFLAHFLNVSLIFFSLSSVCRAAPNHFALYTTINGQSLNLDNEHDELGVLGHLMVMYDLTKLPILDCG